MPTQCIMHAALALCFLLMRITLNNYGPVKVINNASGTRLAGGYPQTGMQSPIESEFKIPSLNLDTIKQQQKQTYRLCNVRTGYVL